MCVFLNTGGCHFWGKWIGELAPSESTSHPSCISPKWSLSINDVFRCSYWWVHMFHPQLESWRRFRYAIFRGQVVATLHPQLQEKCSPNWAPLARQETVSMMAAAQNRLLLSWMLASIHIPSISILCTWNEDSLKRSGHRKWAMKEGATINRFGDVVFGGVPDCDLNTARCC